MTTQTEPRETLPVHVTDRLLGGKNTVRVALVEHPATKELAPCVPVADYADAFSYDREAIRRMIERTPWLKKQSCSVVMTDHLGRYQPHQTIFEQAALGIFMKLQPKRCKDPDVAARIDALQEELIMILHDALKGYRREHDAGYPFEVREGCLPRPGLSMDAIASLVREADKYLRGKASLRALAYFTGMPVDDLATEIETTAAVSSPLAAIFLQYFQALREMETERFAITRGTNEAGNFYLEAETRALFTAFLHCKRTLKLPAVAATVAGLASALSREAPALEYLGIRRTLNRRIVDGHRFHRYEWVTSPHDA